MYMYIYTYIYIRIYICVCVSASLVFLGDAFHLLSHPQAEGRELAFTRYCHRQYCAVYIAITGGRGETLYCAIVWAMTGWGGVPKQRIGA